MMTWRWRRCLVRRVGSVSVFLVGTSASVTVTDDAKGAAESLAEIHTYFTPEQVRSSPKVLIGTVEEIADQVLERRAGLGLTYQVLRGAAPEVLGSVISRVRDAAE
jgi:hypothetical protein